MAVTECCLPVFPDAFLSLLTCFYFFCLPGVFPTFESDVGLGHSKQPKRPASESGEEGESGNPPLEVNSMVQITLDKGNQVFGIIRWLGYLPQIKHKMAGVELVRSKRGLTR